MNAYEIQLLHRTYVKDEPVELREVYRFKTRFNRVYFIIVEIFEMNIYAIKFHLRIHKDLPNKYKIEINDGDAFRIFSTCIKMAEIILKSNPEASFGFIGQNSDGESTHLTQRYRIYNQLAKRYFDPKKFNHHKDEINSIYFLENKKNRTVDIDKINRLLNQYYIFPDGD